MDRGGRFRTELKGRFLSEALPLHPAGFNGSTIVRQVTAANAMGGRSSR